MTAPNAAAANAVHANEPSLEEELRAAERDFAGGDFIEVTVEELERCTLAGKWPWQHESSG
jgi:hypothetical protein